MKKFTEIHILILLFFSISFLHSVEIVNYKFEVPNFRAIASNKNTLAILALEKDISGDFDEGSVFILNQNVVNKLPTTIKYGSQLSYLLVSLNSRIRFDSLNNIWMSGLSLYNYNTTESKWYEHFIDDSNRVYREFQQLCVDKFNNVWVTTSVFNNKSKLQFSELYKFENNKFKLILKFEKNAVSFIARKHSNIMAALPDGRILVYRTLQVQDDDYIKQIYDDLYFINQDGSFEKQKMLTSNGTNILEIDKALSDIYVKSSDDYYFTFDKRDYLDSQDNGHTCCAGLTNLKNNSWYIFNEKNGLSKKFENSYEQMFGITEIKENEFLLIGFKKLFYLNSDKILTPIYWETIFNKSKYIVSNSKVEAFQKQIFDTYSDQQQLTQGNIGEILKDNSGNILILINSGIITFNPRDITSVESEEGNKDISIFPNPSKDFIIINSNLTFDKFEIYDVIGNLIVSDNYHSYKITINSLSNGFYIIKLLSNNGISNTQFFNKID